MTEDQLLNKYETEYSSYCFNVLDITNGEDYLAKLENGDFWDWLKEHHEEEYKALNN